MQLPICRCERVPERAATSLMYTKTISLFRRPGRQISYRSARIWLSITICEPVCFPRGPSLPLATCTLACNQPGQSWNTVYYCALNIS
eukprot:6186996-Pleurochrysis_carterae.AAC.1